MTFEGKKIADINDADVGKLCVKAYARAKSNEPRDVTIKQAFLDTSKGDNVKRLKVVFQVDAAPSDLYSGVDYLFVGVLPDATTHFSYSKEVTVANNPDGHVPVLAIRGRRLFVPCPGPHTAPMTRRGCAD